MNRKWTDKQGIRMLENNIAVIQGENCNLRRLKDQFSKDIIRNKERIKRIMDEIELKQRGHI